MAFSHLKIKVHSYKKAMKKYKASSAKEKNHRAFKTGYYTGFNEALKWLISISGCSDIGTLKEELTKWKFGKLNKSDGEGK